MLISEADVLNDVSKPSKPVEISSSQLLSEITKGSEECFISAWIFRLKLLTKFVVGNWDLNLTDKALWFRCCVSASFCGRSLFKIIT